MMVPRGLVHLSAAMANPPFQSLQAQPESGVRGNVPAPFGAGERLQSPTYRYLRGKILRQRVGFKSALGGLQSLQEFGLTPWLTGACDLRLPVHER